MSFPRYFSSLGTATLGLWECISGGMDWQAPGGCHGGEVCMKIQTVSRDIKVFWGMSQRVF